jgi:hypothetical protein
VTAFEAALRGAKLGNASQPRSRNKPTAARKQVVKVAFHCQLMATAKAMRGWPVARKRLIASGSGFGEESRIFLIRW